jgi:hypothetical protein
MALHSLARVLPLWSSWLEKAVNHPALKDATYRLPRGKPKFLGSVVQNFRLRGGNPTQGFQRQIDRLFGALDETLLPALRDSDLAFEEAKYEATFGSDHRGYCLALVPDFNTLVTSSHLGSTPVFALSDTQIGAAGSVLQQNQAKRQEFHGIYETAASRIVQLLS